MKQVFFITWLAVFAVSSFNASEIRPFLFESGYELLRGNRTFEGRITNGQAANPKQFPYQAGLRLTHSDGNYWCGGTLLSARWIVTAAHCTLGASKIQVILGSLRNKPNGDAGEVVIDFTATSSNVFVHKKYNKNTLLNDISLIKLPGPVTMSDYIKPAKLPKFSGNAPAYTGKTGTISGWGRVSDSSSGVSGTLQWANVPVISNAACAIYGPQPKSVICIGTKNNRRSICYGDSGGPLVLKGTDTLIGVTSFIITSTCESGYPAGFTRVTSFLGWIKQISGLTP